MYVGLPEHQDMLDYCNEAPIHIMNKEGKVNTQKLMDLMLGRFKRADGYLSGHELSHATAYANDPNGYRDRAFNTNKLCDIIILPETITQEEKVIIDAALDSLFQNSEEARNILGLGMDASFNRGDAPIVSEYDFLCEQLRTSQWLRIYNSQAQNGFPKVCMALLTLMFQLKEQSMNPGLVLAGEMEALRVTLEEVETDRRNIETIQQQLTSAHYRVHLIQGDGNCGFYAILQALHSDQNYAHVQQNDQQWNDAAQLRRAIAVAPGLDHLRGMTTTPLGTEDQQMGFDALPAVARHLNRPLVVINTTPTTNHPMFAYYDQGGNHYEAINFRAALDTGFVASSISSTPDSTLMFDLHTQARREQPIVLLYRPGHWEAVLPNHAPHTGTLGPVPLEERHGCFRFFGFRV